MRVLITLDLDGSRFAQLQTEFPSVTFLAITVEDEALDVSGECEVIFGGSVSERLIEGSPNLKWLHVRSAGVNHLPLELLASRGVLLTNSSGAHGIPIAENILALMLAFAIRLPRLIKAQQEHEWLESEVDRTKFEMHGQKLMIIGLGDIGGTLAKKAQGLGLHVLGVRNRPLAPPDGVDELIRRDQLLEALGRADHVALCLPLTAETTGIIGERELRAMKPTAYIYNVGRGKSIDRSSLLRALAEGWIAGAGLDVTDPEPIPPDDELWSLPNVILTQHTSGSSPHNVERVIEIFRENLRRYLLSEQLLNVVVLQRRY